MAIPNELKRYIDTILKDLKVTNSIANGTRLPGSEIGVNSLISGTNNAAQAPHSAAIGSNNEVSKEANSAVALGEGTKAYSDFQLVHGKFNDLDANNIYAHIVGGGKYNEPKNIYTLDWEGNAEFAGSIKTNAVPETNNSLINLEYFNSNIPIKFFPYTELDDKTVNICVNDLDPYTIYKVKMERPYTKVNFVTRVNGMDVIFLSSDSSINKYNMFVSSKTDTTMTFIVNSVIYEIDLITGRVIKKYDNAFAGPGTGGEGGSITDLIDDNAIIDPNKTWSSKKLTDEFGKLTTALNGAFTKANIENNNIVFYNNDNVELSRINILDLLSSTPGYPGQILSIDSDGNTIWIDKPESGGVDNLSDLPYSNPSYPNITNAQQAFDELLYTAPSIVSFTSVPSVREYEIGSVIIAPVIFNWSLNKTVVNQVISDIGNIPVGTFTAKYNNSIASNKTFTLTVSDNKNNTATKSITFSFLYPKYYGAVVEPDVYDNDFILNLSGYKLASSRNGTFNVNADTNEYIYFCIPIKWGTPTFNVGGFDGGFFKVAEINFTNNSGYTEPYSIWRSDNLSLGSQSVTVK